MPAGSQTQTIEAEMTSEAATYMHIHPRRKTFVVVLLCTWNYHQILSPLGFMNGDDILPVSLICDTQVPLEYICNLQNKCKQIKSDEVENSETGKCTEGCISITEVKSFIWKLNQYKLHYVPVSSSKTSATSQWVCSVITVTISSKINK